MERNTVLVAFFAAIILIGTITETPPVIFLGLAVGLILLAGRLWAQSGAHRLDYDHFASVQRCMISDEVQLNARIDNPSFLPLPWVEISDLVPREGFELFDENNPHTQDQLSISTGLAWFQRLQRTYTVKLTARGYYRLGPTTIRIWDPLGLTFVDKRLKGKEAILVYPITVSLGDLGISADDPFGDPEQQRWLYRDPFSVAGARPYQPGDPVKQIHWPATASTGELMTKQLEGIRSPDLLIFLNVRTMEKAWHGTVTEFHELSLCAAASVARYGNDRGYRVGLYSNGNQHKENSEMAAPPLRVDASSNPRQLRKILSALARAAPHASRPLNHTLSRQLSAEHLGTSIVVITAIITDELRRHLNHLNKQGFNITVLYVGDPPGPKLQGIKYHELGGKRRWKEIARQWEHSSE